MSERGYRAQFDAARGTLPGHDVAWLDDLRGRAIARFSAHGFPGPKVEEWRYADLNRLAGDPYRLADRPGAAAADLLDSLVLPAESHRLVFVNGRLDTALSGLGALPAGVTVLGLAEALSKRPDLIEGRFADPDNLVEDRLSGQEDPRPFAFVTLNTAFAGDGAVIHLVDAAAAELPIHIVHLAVPSGDQEMIQSRNLIVAGARSSALVVETYASAFDKAYFNNSVTEIHAAKDAHVRHYRLQAEGPKAVHIGTTLVRLADEAAYDGFVLSTGAAYARNEVRAALDGEYVHCRLNGVCLARDDQRMDVWTRVDHLEANGTVSETFKSVLDGRARTAFQGKIRVWPGADKTDAHQLNRNLLLSSQAQADSKPELEILADDVRCSHGATVGDIDDQALFYLRARGIDETNARNLLVEAFVGELIDVIGYGTAHDYLRAALDRWLDGLDGGDGR